MFNTDSAKHDANTTEIDFNFYEKLVDCIAVSETLKSTLKTKLKQSFESPRTFYNEDGEFLLSERGLTYPENKSLTSKFVLIDTMIEGNEMIEVDWKEEEEEVRSAIKIILKTKGYKNEFSELNKFENEDTFEILQLINSKELNLSGYSLEIIDIDSDSYVFTVVPLNKHDETKAMFAALK